MDKILVDTDVILDFLFDRKPFSDQSSTILSLCEKGHIRGFITSVTVSNTYYLLRKVAKHEKVIESLKTLLTILDVAITDKNCVLNALNSDFKDFEDALQHFSALDQSEIKIIITRNVKDYKSSQLSVMQPDMYLQSFK